MLDNSKYRMIVINFVLLSLVSIATSAIVPEDCDAMSACNLTEVAASQANQFSDMSPEEKLQVCQAVKLSLDCSSLYRCQRQERLLPASKGFFDFLCKNILKSNQIPMENCIGTESGRTKAKCESHLNKIKIVSNKISPEEDATREACCAFREYEECYRNTLGKTCSLKSYSILTSPETTFRKFCSNYKGEECSVSYANETISAGIRNVANSSAISSTSFTSTFAVIVFSCVTLRSSENFLS